MFPNLETTFTSVIQSAITYNGLQACAAPHEYKTIFWRRQHKNKNAKHLHFCSRSKKIIFRRGATACCYALCYIFIIV